VGDDRQPGICEAVAAMSQGFFKDKGYRSSVFHTSVLCALLKGLLVEREFDGFADVKQFSHAKTV
jgi:hypothetical protein